MARPRAGLRRPRQRRAAYHPPAPDPGPTHPHRPVQPFDLRQPSRGQRPAFRKRPARRPGPHHPVPRSRGRGPALPTYRHRHLQLQPRSARHALLLGFALRPEQPRGSLPIRKAEPLGRDRLRLARGPAHPTSHRPQPLPRSAAGRRQRLRDHPHRHQPRVPDLRPGHRRAQPLRKHRRRNRNHLQQVLRQYLPPQHLRPLRGHPHAPPRQRRGGRGQLLPGPRQKEQRRHPGHRRRPPDPSQLLPRDRRPCRRRDLACRRPGRQQGQRLFPGQKLTDRAQQHGQGRRCRHHLCLGQGTTRPRAAARGPDDPR